MTENNFPFEIDPTDVGDLDPYGISGDVGDLDADGESLDVGDLEAYAPEDIANLGSAAMGGFGIERERQDDPVSEPGEYPGGIRTWG